LPVSVNTTNIAGASPGTAFNLTFDANAQTTISVRYADVGEVQLLARHDGTGDESGLVMLGNDLFIARPIISP
jgi:MSHA biogenesis protein MshQ